MVAEPRCRSGRPKTDTLVPVMIGRIERRVHRRRTLPAFLAAIFSGVAAAECPSFGTPRQIAEGFAAPRSATFLADGSLLVADPAAGAVVVLDPRGGRAGELASPEGWRQPSAAAALRDGAIVADAAAGRLDRFDATGRFVATLRQRENWSPSAVAFGAGRIAVLDEGRRSLELLDEQGEPVALVSARSGAGPEPLWRRPAGVAIADDGRIFVSDGDRHRIVVLGREGEPIGAFGDRGPFPGLLHDPAGLAIRGECLFVADRLNHRVSLFSLDGRFLGQWGLHAVRPRAAEGEVHYPQAVAISADGTLAAVVEPFERRVQWFAHDPAPPEAAAAIAPSREGVMSHFGRGLAAEGDLLAMWEPESASVVLFDWRRALPIHVTTFGGPTGRGRAAPDRFGRIEAIAIDPRQPRLAVADAGEQRLAFFDLDWDRGSEIRFDPFMARLAGTVDLRLLAESCGELLPSSDPRRAIEPADLLWTPSGALLLLDRREGVVLVVAPTRPEAAALPTELVSVWGDRGAAGGRFDRPSALAICDDGAAIAVLDARGIVRLSLEGTVLGQIPRPRELSRAAGLGEGLAPLPTPRGTVWVLSDPREDRLVAIDSRGEIVANLGERGGEDGQLWLPQALRSRSDGTLIVVDAGNHRAAGFRLEGGGDDPLRGEWAITFSLGRASTRPRGAITP